VSQHYTYYFYQLFTGMSDLFASNFQANSDQCAQLLHLCCNAMLQTQRCALPETFTDR